MSIVQIVGFGLVAAILALLLKNQHPQMAMMVSLAAGLGLLLMVLSGFGRVVEVFHTIADKTGVPETYFSTAMKVMGVALLTEFGAQICRDAGEGSIAQKMEIGGKIIMLLMAAPVLLTLVEVVSGMVSGL